MKMNLLSYLREYGEKSFHEVPFSEVDALVLAQMSYLKMDGMVPGFQSGPGVSWKDLEVHPQTEKMFEDQIFGPGYKRIFHLIKNSRRYGKIRINYFVEWFNEETQIQFSAVTFFLGKTSVFVAYRGTDESLVGWKEDFNMGYMKSIPSQRRALAYLKGVARYTDGRMILGGHSKGGNLAIYAASNSSREIQERIRRIYSFDGPGFRKEFYNRSGFRQVQDRFCKILPEESLVGMLFSNYQIYRVVESYHSGLVQHNPMQWKIRKGTFVYRKDLAQKSKRTAVFLDLWFNSLSRGQVVDFVETLYELLSLARMDSVYQLLLHPFRSIHRLFGAFHRLDKGKKRTFLEIIAALFKQNRK